MSSRPGRRRRVGESERFEPARPQRTERISSPARAVARLGPLPAASSFLERFPGLGWRARYSVASWPTPQPAAALAHRQRGRHRPRRRAGRRAPACGRRQDPSGMQTEGHSLPRAVVHAIADDPGAQSAVRDAEPEVLETRVPVLSLTDALWQGERRDAASGEGAGHRAVRTFRVRPNETAAARNTLARVQPKMAATQERNAPGPDAHYQWGPVRAAFRRRPGARRHAG
jgi:hypothetical protein